MQLITIPTEQTTAITDAILGLEAFLLAGFFQRFMPVDRLRARYWQMLLLLTGLASFQGTVAHGFEMSKGTYELLWKPLLITLGLIIANIVLVTLYDLCGRKTAKRACPLLLAMALGFFAITFIPGVTFLIFIVYEAIGMLFALIAYTYLAARKKRSGAGIIAMGIVLQIAAAVAQAAGPYEFQVVWSFNHNGIYHLIGMVATLIMILGALKGFRNEERQTV